MSQSKSDLRNQVRMTRKNNPVNTDFDYLLDIPEIGNSEVIASYYPTEFEPNLLKLNSELLIRKKILLLPRIINSQIEFVKFEGGELNRNGIFQEPIGLPFFGEINTILVPALAVDRNGYRLGQGGGYYDRFLTSTNAYRIAVINDSEFLKSLPFEWHDQKVDAVALGGRLVRIS